MTVEENRLIRLEEQRINMAQDITDLKVDLKDFKSETKQGLEKVNAKIDQLSLQIAKWAGAVAVIVTIAQIVIGKLLEKI